MKALVAILVAGICVTTAAAAGPAMKHTGAGNALAAKSLLTLKELGKGWTATKTTSASLQLSCTGYQPSGKGIVETGSAGSPNFSAGNAGPFLVQLTSVFASARQASTLWNRAVKPGLITCVAQTLNTITTKGIKVKITSQGALPIKNVADRTAAYRVAATLSSSKNKSLKTYFDVVLVQVGQTVTEITFSSLVAPVPPVVEHGLALVVARHLTSGGPVA